MSYPQENRNDKAHSLGIEVDLNGDIFSRHFLIYLHFGRPFWVEMRFRQETIRLLTLFHRRFDQGYPFALARLSFSWWYWIVEPFDVVEGIRPSPS
jgi:hypothetical protein